MQARWLLALIVIACAACGSSSSSRSDRAVENGPDGGAPDGGAPDRGAPVQVTVGATCVGEGGDQAGASIGVDGVGNALVAWPRRVGGDLHVVTCSLRDGVWQAGDIGAGTRPIVALAMDGSGMVLWAEPTGGSLLAARYVDGQLGAPTTVVPNPVAYHDLALLPDGDAVVLTSGLELRSYHYDAQSGTWDPIPRTLPVTANAIIASPRLGATADGLIAVWQESDQATSQRSIRAARFNPSAGQWTSSSEFADVAAVPARSEAMLALDTAPPDHAIVVLDLPESRAVSASAYDAAAGRWTPQVLYDNGDVSPPHFASGGVDV